MGKGIGMPSAKRASTGAVVRADAVETKSGPFKCLGCGVPVRRVSGYPLHGEDPDLKRFVQPFFRLPTGEENQHVSNCGYTPAGQVKLLVDRAVAVEDSVNPFTQKEVDGSIVFRMNIPMEELERERVPGPPLEKPDYPARVEQVWSGRRLASFCRSAVGLAKLWQELETRSAQADLRKRVRIALKGKQIRWEDFFFPPENLGEFADKVEGKALDYPVALLLHVKKITRTKQGKLKAEFTPMQDNTASQKTYISVNVFGPGEIIADFVPGQHYILFGEFWHQNENVYAPAGTSIRSLYRNFGVKLFSHAQFERLDVADVDRESA